MARINQQQAFEQAVQHLQEARPDMSDIQSSLLASSRNPLWVARGVAHMTWGDEERFVVAIGETMVNVSREEISHIIEEMGRFISAE